MKWLCQVGTFDFQGKIIQTVMVIQDKYSCMKATPNKYMLSFQLSDRNRNNEKMGGPKRSLPIRNANIKYQINELDRFGKTLCTPFLFRFRPPYPSYD